MRITTVPHTRGVIRVLPGPLGGILVGGLLFSVCTLSGVLLGPWVSAESAPGLGRQEDTAALMARWRRSVSRVEDDLRPGAPAPHFSLPAPSGRLVALQDLRGRKVALVFLQDGAT